MWLESGPRDLLVKASSVFAAAVLHVKVVRFVYLISRGLPIALLRSLLTALTFAYIFI